MADVAAVTAAGKMLPALLSVFKEIQATRSKIKSNNRLVCEWKERPFAGYRYKLNELLRVSRDMHNEDLMQCLNDLKTQMEEHLVALEAFCDEEAASSKSAIASCWRGSKEVCTQHRQHAMEALTDTDRRLARAIDDALELVHRVQRPEAIYNRAQEAEWRKIEDGLRERYAKIQPIIDDLRRRKQRLGDASAVVMFRDEQDLAKTYQKTLEVFWTDVQALFKPQKDPNGGPSLPSPWANKEEEFFSGNWLDKAILAREVGEPLDTANWYFKDKHINNVAPRRMPHYIHGVFVSEYTYSCGLRAAVGRVDVALAQLRRQAAVPWSDFMGAAEGARREDEVAGLQRALGAVEHEAAVGAVGAAVSVLNDARRKRKPVPTAGYNSGQVEANRQKALAREKEAEAVLEAKLGLLRACTGSLSERAAAILALMDKVQGEAQLAPPDAGVWDALQAVDDDLAADQAAGRALDRCAAAGARELARWVGWRVGELKASAAAVDEAAQALAADALETPPLENVPVAVAAVQEAHGKLAAAAGDGVVRVGVRDNDSRPGRYQLIQKQEVRYSGRFGEPATSLALARQLQWLGSGKVEGIPFKEGARWPASIAHLLVPPEVSSA